MSFNPVATFKEMHQDKLLDGRGSDYAPCKCIAFLYSKMNLPILSYAFKRPIDFKMILDESVPPDIPAYEKIDLRKIDGPDENGFCGYAVLWPDSKGESE